MKKEELFLRATIYPIVGFLIIFFVYASMAEIDESVRGEGRVVPSSQTQILQHLEGGIISEILVKEGDSVEAGAIIYRLDQAFFEAELKEVELELLSFEAKEERLRVQLSGKKELNFSEKLTKKIPQIVQTEQKIFEAQNRKNREKLRGFEDEINQKRLEISELAIRLSNLELEMKLSNETLVITERLLKSKAVSRKEYLGELAKKQALITQTGEVKNRIPVIEEQINFFQSSLQNEKAGIESALLSELNEAILKKEQLLEKIKASSDRQKRKAILSPLKGIVNKLYFYTVGGIIKAGDKVAEITPLDETLLIEAQIKPSDRARIWSGQKAKIEITAFDFTKYGLLDGEIISVSPDSFPDSQGRPFYKISVKAKKERFGEDKPIMPGMVANVNVITGRKTILEYILVPLKRVSINALQEP